MEIRDVASAHQERNLVANAVAQGLGPAAILLATSSLGLEKPTLQTWLNITIIVVGTMIASFGEIKFVLSGFMFQMGGLFFEAFRLALVQRLLSSQGSKMDPLVSLYYYSPVCALMILVPAVFVELPSLTIRDLRHVGLWTLAANAATAFLLNVSGVLLVCFCAVTLLKHNTYYQSADRENVFFSPYPLRCPQEHYHRACIYPVVEDSGNSGASSGVHNRNDWLAVLFVWR